MRLAFLVALLVALLAGPVRAADEEDDPLTRRAEAAVESFEEEFGSREKEERILALVRLSEIDHELVIEAITKRGFRDREEEVRDVAAQALGRMEAHAELAGEVLADQLDRQMDHPEVLISIARSIGKLGYEGARKELIKACRYFRKEEYRWVVVEVIRTFGVLEDVRALPWLLTMWEYQGKTKRGRSGPSVYSVHGREAAKEEYEAKYGHLADPEGGPDMVMKWWMQAVRTTVKKPPGEEFEDALAFRKWLREHRRELGLDRPERR